MNIRVALVHVLLCFIQSCLLFGFMMGASVMGGFVAAVEGALNEKSVLSGSGAIRNQVGNRREATRASRQAILDILEMLEDPDLYYDEHGQGDGPRWIWSAASTTPRDVLLVEKRPPRLHVVVTVDDLFGMVASFGIFVGHYKALGVREGDIMFDIRRYKYKDESEEEVAYNRLTRLIESVGSEYCTTYMGVVEVEGTKQGVIQRENGYVALLNAMDGIPLNDWVFMVYQTDKVSVGEQKTGRQNSEAAMWEFLDGCERDGINSVWGRSSAAMDSGFIRSNGIGHDDEDEAEDSRRLVALRGYLRPDLSMRRSLSLHEAENLFEGSYFQTYAPYVMFWELYKGPSVLGNAYLWGPRGSSSDARFFDLGILNDTKKTQQSY